MQVPTPVHQKEPIRFEARWALSYLKGPMTLVEIDKLSCGEPAQNESSNASGIEGLSPENSFSAIPPVLSGSLGQRFAPSPVLFKNQKMTPWLAGVGTVRFFDAGRGIDQSEDLCLRLPLSEADREADWQNAEAHEVALGDLLTRKPEGCLFSSLPSWIYSLKDFRDQEKSLEDYLYATRKLIFLKIEALKKNFPALRASIGI